MNQFTSEIIEILVQKGIKMTEIPHLIEKIYSHHYTPQTISNKFIFILKVKFYLKGAKSHLHKNIDALYLTL